MGKNTDAVSAAVEKIMSRGGNVALTDGGVTVVLNLDKAWISFVGDLIDRRRLCALVAVLLEREIRDEGGAE